MLQARFIENISPCANAAKIQIPSGSQDGPFPMDTADFAGLVSTITVETLIAMNEEITFSFGPDVEMACRGTISQGEDGIEELRKLARVVLRCCNTALEPAFAAKLTPEEKAYFEALINDFIDHGFVMLMFGKIEL